MWRIVAMGVAFVNTLQTTGWWLIRKSRIGIQRTRAFSVALADVRTSLTFVKRAVDEGHQISNSQPFLAVAKALVTHKIVTGKKGINVADDIGERVPNGDSSIFIVLSMIAALCRARALKDGAPRRDGEQTIDWDKFFGPFCFWGQYVLEGVRRGYIVFEPETGTIYVDVKEMTMMRIDLHMALHRFMLTFRAVVTASQALEEPIVVEKRSYKVSKQDMDLISRARKIRRKAVLQQDEEGAEEF